jgi:hypothetical protein
MLNLDDYLNAPCGMGPLADEWKDNPHRLIYDLVHEIKILHPLKTKQQRIKISYSSKAGAYYLASEGDEGISGYGNIYYQKDSTELHQNSPTWFETQKKAIDSATHDGFIVDGFK